MADDDNFDIDIYGDGGDGGDQYQEEGQLNDDEQPSTLGNDTNMQDNGSGDYEGSYDEHNHPAPDTSLPKPPIPPTQGGKRKDGPDDRPVDPGATNALFVGELSWWTTDDDIRGWTKEAGCEDELKDLTFNEQKVNGKSKGQVYMLFDTPNACTSVKHKIDEYSQSMKYRIKFTVSYTNPLQNPFKTLPKDGPARQNRTPNPGPVGGNFSGGHTPGFRGRGRGNFNSGGGGGGYNNRGGFQGGQGNFGGQPMAGGFQGVPLGGMPAFGGAGYGGRGGFQGGRGGNMGMRGGRGGMQPQMGMGMPMPGGMMPNMGMGMPMGGGMGMPAGGFQGGYNPAFQYAQISPTGGDAGWSNGSNKRPRQE